MNSQGRGHELKDAGDLVKRYCHEMPLDRSKSSDFMATPIQPLPVPFSYYCNRSGYRTAAKVPGTYRIAFIGDSMSYGQGVPAGETLPDQVTDLLNVAVAGLWVESLNLGIPGACLFHDLGRMMYSGVHLCPDLMVLVLCENDAAMLRLCSPVLEHVGQTWLDFKPLINAAFEEFREQALHQKDVRVVVVYFSRYRQMGSVMVPTVIREICIGHDLPFIDVSQALVGYDADSLCVSPADEHLNSLAHRVAAQHVARFILENNYLPECSDFEHPAWISAIESYPSKKISAGMAPYVACLQTRLVLEKKWDCRGNRRRTVFGAEFARAVKAVAEQENRELAGLAIWELCRQPGRDFTYWERYLLRLEESLPECATLAFALRYHAANDEAGQDLLEIGSLRRFEETSTSHLSGDEVLNLAAGELCRISREMRSRLCRLENLHRTVLASRPAPCNPDTEHFLGFFGKLHGLHWDTEEVLLRVLASLRALRCRAVVEKDIRTLALYLLDRFQYLGRCLREAFAQFPLDFLEKLSTSFIHSSWMRLELLIAAPPPSEPLKGPWYLEISAAGVYPSYQGHYVHCQYLARDDQHHQYLVDIPFFVRGEIQVQLIGNGIQQAWKKRQQARFTSSILRVSGLNPIDIHKGFLRTDLGNDCACFTYGSICLWEHLHDRTE